MKSPSLEKIGFEAAGQKITGAVVRADRGEPRALFLHGSGESNKERMLPMASELARRYGINSVIFDFAGHGESSGTLGETTLEQRQEIAIGACRLFPGKRPDIIFGFSMGAHIALAMLPDCEPDVLGLFCPAVYNSRAKSVSYAHGFLSYVPDKDSWRQNSVLANLRAFRGKLFIATGTEDTMISPDVVGEIAEAAAGCVRKKLIRLPGVDHHLARALASDHNLMDQVMGDLESFAF